MVNPKLQGRGAGSKIIAECLQYLRPAAYTRVRPGYAKGNPQPKAFWEKNGFRPTGIESVRRHYTAAGMERIL